MNLRDFHDRIQPEIIFQRRRSRAVKPNKGFSDPLVPVGL